MRVLPVRRNGWLVRGIANSAQARLFCFSYAGGSAAFFHPWQRQLGDRIEICAVQLPGRGDRFNESPCREMSVLVEAIANSVASEDGLPFAFFGHSLGAILAYEVAGRLVQMSRALPRALILSGCEAPQSRSEPENLHLLEDRALIEKLREFNGTPPEILANQELMSVLLPTIRADFELAENYAYSVREPLPVPLVVLVGKDDEHTKPENVEPWRMETSNRCEIRWLEGDHFFILSEKAEVMRCIEEELLPLPTVERKGKTVVAQAGG